MVLTRPLMNYPPLSHLLLSSGLPLTHCIFQLHIITQNSLYIPNFITVPILFTCRSLCQKQSTSFIHQVNTFHHLPIHCVKPQGKCLLSEHACSSSQVQLTALSCELAFIDRNIDTQTDTDIWRQIHILVKHLPQLILTIRVPASLLLNYEHLKVAQSRMYSKDTLKKIL